MFVVQIGEVAEIDLRTAAHFYERQQDGLGAYFLKILEQDLRQLQISAGVHARPTAGLHRALSRRFPYAIYYQLTGKVVNVHAVLDQRQDPRSIHARLGA